MATKLAAKPVRRATRKVYAPTSGGVGMTSGSLLSITLEEDEDVVWHWAHYQDGQRAVTGYTIVPNSLRSLMDRLPQ